MYYSKEEAIQFIEQNDVKFIRLAFTDIFGKQKNVSIMPNELNKAFESGISFDASAIEGFKEESKSDLFLIPDARTMSLLPWRPTSGRVVRFFCDIYDKEKKPFISDSRYILKQAVSYAAEQGYSFLFGPECEFYLFKTDEEGNSTNIPLDNGTYMDIAPCDKGENVRREICLTLEQMGINPEKSHHEEGPGQNEIDFAYSDAISAADNLTAFKAVVAAIAARNGLYADFSAKPIKDKAGNGLHVNMSVKSINKKDTTTNTRDYMICGILNRIREITLWLNNSENSYQRLSKFKAPGYVTWAYSDRSQLIRIPASIDSLSRIEVRSADPMANPYLSFALLIYASMEGINNRNTPPAPMDMNLYKSNIDTVRSIQKLPDSLNEAKRIASESEFVKRHLPADIIESYINRRTIG
ncbi:MAG TPA: glutamine synthetase family protein [Clostridia bacterium]|nr:glutamine synthetase family protein [Clostridia bacterium]HQM39331.1 glutamine synthetase family protein [Clostridia bacterium]